MKLIIDHLNETIGWTVNAPSEIDTLDYKGLIAGLNDLSLIINFNSDDSIKTATKSIGPIDVSGYENLVFSVWSSGLGKQGYYKADDFNYKIKLNDTDEFYLPVYDTFHSVNIALDDVDEIDRIEIIALHGQSDFLVMSEMIAEHEELPLDILVAVKDSLQRELSGSKFKVAELTATAGDNEVSFSGDRYFLEHYAVVEITDGVNTEMHQLADGDGTVFKFNSLYDGKTVQNNFTNADVRITFPVDINPDERSINIPGVTIWGVSPEAIMRTSKLYEDIVSFKTDDTFYIQQEGQLLEHEILIDCVGRQSELVGIMSTEVRKFIENELLWVNGRKHDVSFAAVPEDIRPQQGIDIIPKIQYTIRIESMENYATRKRIPKTTSINIDTILEG